MNRRRVCAGRVCTPPTALMRVQDVNCCRLLLKHNVRINGSDQYGRNAIITHLQQYRPINMDICSLLYAAGEDTPNVVKRRCDNESIIVADYLPQIQIKFDLKHLSRAAIRKHLIDLDPHTHLFGRIPRLEIPHTLHGYLLYGQTLDYPNP